MVQYSVFFFGKRINTFPEKFYRRPVAPTINIQ